MNDFNILAYGAAADGVRDDAPALQQAIDAAHAAGGGRVLIQRGCTVRAGGIELRSRVELHLEKHARLVSATHLEAFPRRVFDQGPEAEKRLWIGCRDAEDVVLSGPGTIDGQCHAFALGETEHIIAPNLAWRPATTCFENCRRLRIQDLNFTNAANWTLHFAGCVDVDVRDVRIANDPRFPNADGIDPDHCRRVRIRGCQIVSGDDCIAIKNTASFARYGPSEDIQISDCRLESGSSAVKIGSESVDAFRGIRVERCRIEASNRGLAIQLRDGGDVEDVEFREIEVETRRRAPVWWGAGEIICVTSLPRSAGVRAGTIRDVRFRHIRGRGENGVVVFAEPAGRIDGLLLEHVDLGLARQTEWNPGFFDLRPCDPGYLPPGGTPAGEPSRQGRPAVRPPAVFSFEGARRVSLREVTSSLAPGDFDGWLPLRASEPVDGLPR